MAKDMIASHGCVLENIEIGDSNCLDSETVVERGEGEYLVLERFFSHIRKTKTDKFLVYGVLCRLTAEEFYELIDKRSTGVCLADDIADWLVKAFDRDVARELPIRFPVLWAYRTADGKYVTQHST